MEVDIKYAMLKGKPSHFFKSTSLVSTYFLQTLARVEVDPSAIGLSLASHPPADPSLHSP